MQLFDRLDKVSKGTARVLSLIGLGGLLCLSFATVMDVLLTWLFNDPIVGLRDASSLFVAIVIASALPVCTAERRHITIMFIGALLKERWQARLDVFANLVTLSIFILMTRQLWLYTNELAKQNEVTMVLWWPVSPWWRGVSILVGCCVLIQLIVTLHSIRSAFWNKG
ncbi:MAG: TRAP transporter small permease [Deltaproteobacteria bacterium]|nr:TRAP transporter small permease [Deltaproteobacteria bacterium]